jgi:large subunit ribosomal protein L15
MPLHRRLPKRGFTNIFRTEYTIVNLERLAELGEDNITHEVLVQKGLAGKNDLVKVLGDGELKSPISVQAHKFSKSAADKIAKSGGKAELIGGGTPATTEEKPKSQPKAAPQAKSTNENKQEKKKQKK